MPRTQKPKGIIPLRSPSGEEATRGCEIRLVAVSPTTIRLQVWNGPDLVAYADELASDFDFTLNWLTRHYPTEKAHASQT